jgi:hypothetical protein
MGTKPYDIGTILAAVADYTSPLFSVISRLREERWFSLSEIAKYLMTHWTQVVGWSKDKEETEAPDALKRLEVGRLNEVMIFLIQFIRSAEGNSVFYFNIFLMLQKPMSDLGSLRANKLTETLVTAVSERFSKTTDFNIVFPYFLVTPVRKRDYEAVP